MAHSGSAQGLRKRPKEHEVEHYCMLVGEEIRRQLPGSTTGWEFQNYDMHIGIYAGHQDQRCACTFALDTFGRQDPHDVANMLVAKLRPRHELVVQTQLAPYAGTLQTDRPLCPGDRLSLGAPYAGRAGDVCVPLMHLDILSTSTALYQGDLEILSAHPQFREHKDHTFKRMQLKADRDRTRRREHLNMKILTLL